MPTKSSLKIVSSYTPEFNSKITANNVTYHVQTEDMGKKTCKIISRVYLKGEIVFSKKGDYAHLRKLRNFKDNLTDMMEKQHKATIDLFMFEQSKEKRLKSDYYLHEAKDLLRSGNKVLALNTLKNGLERFPSDPFLLSYCGCLVSTVDNNPREGIRICKDAIESLNKSMPLGGEFYYPVFYLNLGRAYLRRDKLEAIQSFRTGLKQDPENRDILWELNKLGTRKKPPIPFLDRNNPINKYMGIFLSKTTFRRPSSISAS
jgi:tetratricopeptide (TPR) repeat protein